jgi:hypothetical protein
VEVVPGRIQARWEGQTQQLKPAKALQSWLPGLRRSFPDLAEVDVSVPERGALGLYLNGSKVSVKRFTVEPLGDTQPGKGE